jgi:hypothetical protein
MNTATNWAAAIAIALVLSASHLLPGPSDHEAAVDVAANVQAVQVEAAAAQQAARIEQRRATLAAAL